MIDSFGPRPTVPSGPAASLPAVQAGEKVVHRPERIVLPTETVDRAAPTGPRPTFQHTYLEQLAAYWPDEPEPPVTYIDYGADDGRASAQQPVDAASPEVSAAEAGVRVVGTDDAEARPTVDVRW